MQSLIHPNDAWTLWGIMLAWVAISIWLEQKYRWAAKITGPVLALTGAIALSNLKIIPISSPSYDLIWTYIVPVSIPLLLFRANIFKIVGSTGSMFAAFHVSALGTAIGAFIVAIVFQTLVPFATELAGVMTGSYIGGGINFFALVATYRPPEELTNSLLVADNIIMAVMFLLVISLTNFKFFRRNYPMPHQEEVEKGGNADALQAATFWKKKEISLRDIATSLGIAMAIAAVSARISELLKAMDTLPAAVRDIVGNPFLIITVLCVVIATLFHKPLEAIAGADELGTWLIYIFFFTIGIPADIMLLVQEAPLLFVFCVVIAAVNFIVTFGLGKLFRMKLEDLGLSVIACLGGPMNAAAIAIAKGWKNLVLPALLVGIWGYVIGTWAGISLVTLLRALFGGPPA